MNLENLNNIQISDNIKKTFTILDNSYSPYSKFRVGCSIITKNNDIYSGVNIENASFGLTMCAERSAIFNYLSNGMNKEDIDYIIIASDCTDKLTPCGACLQVFSEFLDKDTKIIISSSKNGNNLNIKQYIFSDFMPNIFDKSNILVNI